MVNNICIIFITTHHQITLLSISIIIAAVIFSAFHFFGEYADIPKTSLFILRFVAGIVLGYIYILRGFGIAAYSHSFYNLIVFTQIIPFS